MPCSSAASAQCSAHAGRTSNGPARARLASEARSRQEKRPGNGATTTGHDMKHQMIEAIHGLLIFAAVVMFWVIA